MSLMDKINNWITGGEEMEEMEEDVEQTPIPQNEEPKAPVMKPPATEEPVRRGNKVVNIHATTQLQVVLVKPERFEDAHTIADHLSNKRTVVLNFEDTNKDVVRRLVDFLAGVAYANGGQVKRVASSTFIITPYNVDIMGDLLDELESNGIYF